MEKRLELVNARCVYTLHIKKQNLHNARVNESCELFPKDLLYSYLSSASIMDFRVVPEISKMR